VPHEVLDRDPFGVGTGDSLSLATP